MTDSRIGKPGDGATGAVPASATDLNAIFIAIKGLETSTNTQLNAITARIDDLEKDLAEGSDVVSQSGKNVPVTSSGVASTTATVTQSSTHTPFNTLLTVKPVHVNTNPLLTPVVGKRPLQSDVDSEDNISSKRKKKKAKKSWSKKSHI